LLQLRQSEATAARRRVPLYLVDDTDGKTPKTGVTLTTGDIKISKNGGTPADHAGTITEVGQGLYTYEATAAELDTFGYLSAIVTKATVRTFHAMAQVVGFDPYAAIGGGGGATAAEVADAVWDEARTGHTTAGTFGFYLDAPVSGAGGAGPTAAEIADAVWDELLAGHAISGSTGAALTAASVSAPTAIQVADAILTRDWTAVSGEGARSVLNALRFLRNKWSITTGTLTVTKEDDTTAAWTAALTTQTAAQGITAVDPS
jgi:hypothetical protein